MAQRLIVNVTVMGAVSTRGKELIQLSLLILSIASYHTMSLKLDGKRGTEYLNNKFLLPTLLNEGYNVNLKKATGIKINRKTELISQGNL